MLCVDDCSLRNGGACWGAPYGGRVSYDTPAPAGDTHTGRLRRHRVSDAAGPKVLSTFGNSAPRPGAQLRRARPSATAAPAHTDAFLANRCTNGGATLRREAHSGSRLRRPLCRALRPRKRCAGKAANGGARRPAPCPPHTMTFHERSPRYCTEHPYFHSSMLYKLS
jgi:hypothetical protein